MFLHVNKIIELLCTAVVLTVASPAPFNVTNPDVAPTAAAGLVTPLEEPKEDT